MKRENKKFIKNLTLFCRLVYNDKYYNIRIIKIKKNTFVVRIFGAKG